MAGTNGSSGTEASAQRRLRRALSIGALLWGWGSAALIHAVDPRRRLLVLASMLVPLRSSLYMGFFPFYL